MSATLRDILHISAAASDADVARVCNEYYAIYKSILATAGDPQVRALAQERILALEAAAQVESVALSVYGITSVETPADVCFTEAQEVLSGAGEGLSDSEYRRHFAAVKAMPESAEKHYLLACLIMARKGLTQREKTVNAAKHIADAVSLDGSNLAYTAISKGLEDAISVFNGELAAWKAEKAEEAAHEIIRIENEKRWKKFLEISRKVGKALLWILGGIGTALLAVIGCICECADC
jgi:hypothetical protein